MTSLWIAIIILTALALLFVVIPVWRFRGGTGVEDIEIRKQKNVEVFRQSEQELEEDLGNGQINQEEYDRLHHELQRSFLRDMEAFDSERRSRAVVRHNKLVPVSLAVLAVVGSIVLYQGWGAGRDLVLPQLLDQVRTAEDEASQRGALEDLAVFLQARFERIPDDVQSGYMLGTLYLRLERFSEAETVFERLAQAVTEGPDRATILGQLAQSRYLQAGQRITAEVQRTIDGALRYNPNEYAVMSILAIDAFLQENFAGAVGYWRRQLSQVTPGSREAQALQDRIARVQALIPESERAPDSQVAAGGGASVEVHVELADAIRDEVDQGWRVFIFARSPERPAPVAAQSFTVADLPVSITLDDSSAMAPMFTLSSVEQVYIGARISRSGDATDVQPDDYEIISETFQVAERDEPVNLVIREQVGSPD